MKRVLMARGRKVVIDVDPRDHIGRHLAKGTWYEQDLLTDLAFRARTGIFVDAGAHIGTHSLWAAQGCRLSVHAFEPHTANRRRLATNVAANRAKVTVHREALGAANASGRIVAPRYGNSGTAKVDPSRPGDVKIRTLDSYGLTGVTAVKVDVEGNGADVLAGATRLLARDRPVVYVEAATGPEQAAVAAVLSPLGYRRIPDPFGWTPTWCWVHARLSVAVMAHPSRRAAVDDLIAGLDVEPDVVWDRINDRWDTGRRALAAYDPAASHHLVVQDDSIVCRDLYATAQELCAVAPAGLPVSLYMGRARTDPVRYEMSRIVHAAERRGVPFAELPGPWWGQAVIVPTANIDSVIAYGDAHPEITNYDHRIAWWHESTGRPCLYTVPSLVDHRTGPESPSLLGHGNGHGRRAAKFIGAGTSGRTVDWKPGSVTRAEFGPVPRTPNPPVQLRPGVIDAATVRDSA